MSTYLKTIRIEVKKFKSQGLLTIWFLFTAILTALMLYEGRFGAADSARITYTSEAVRYFSIESELTMILGLALPVLASVIASKLIDEESLHNTWSLLSCANQKLTKLCDIKIIFTYLLVELTTLIVLSISIFQLYLLSGLAVPFTKLCLGFLSLSLVNIITTVTVFCIGLYSQNQILVIVVGLLLGIVGLLSPLFSPTIDTFIPFAYYVFAMLSGQRMLGFDEQGYSLWEYYPLNPNPVLIGSVCIVFICIYFLVRYWFVRKEK